MAWTDTANNLLGGEAAQVIAQLKAIDPNYDWTSAVVDAARTLQGIDGGLDPNRTPGSTVTQYVLQSARQIDPSTVRYSSAIPGLQQLSAQGAAQIQADQATHGGGGLGDLGSILGIGGLALGGLGLAGIGPLSGILGGSAAGAAASGGGLFDAISGLSPTLAATSSLDPALAAAAGATAGTMGVDIGAGSGLGVVNTPVTEGLFADAAGNAAAAGTLGDAASQAVFGVPAASVLAGAASPAISSLVASTPGGMGPLNPSDSGSSGGSSLLNSILGIAPSLAALAYANNMGGVDTSQLQSALGLSQKPLSPVDTSALQNVIASAKNPLAPIDTSALSGVIGQLAGNQNAVVKAATDPVQQNIAAGYGDLMQSLAKRGVMGSSFGNTDIANFLGTTGTTLGNVGASAAEQALGLQGQLSGQLANLGLSQNAQTLQQQSLQGTLANQLANLGLAGNQQQLQQATTQGTLATQLANLGLEQQAIKAGLIGRALGGIGAGLSGSGGGGTGGINLGGLITNAGSGIGNVLSGFGTGLGNAFSGFGTGLNNLFGLA